MAFTLTLLGTDTVYVPEAQDYKLVRCINDKLPDLLEEKTLYISEFKEGSFRYTLLNNERKWNRAGLMQKANTGYRI